MSPYSEYDGDCKILSDLLSDLLLQFAKSSVEQLYPRNFTQERLHVLDEGLSAYTISLKCLRINRVDQVKKLA